MKTIKDIIELYKPKSADEDRFVKKHVIKKTEDANGNKDDLFNGSKIKPINREPNHGYNPGEDEKVYESYSDPKHFKFLRHLQKAGIPAPSKDRAMELIARHGDPDRAGQAFVKRYKLIKNAANKVQKENVELDEAKTKKSPIEKLYNRPSMQFAKKYTKKSAHEIKMERLGFPTRHFPKDETNTGTTSSLEGEAKQKAIEKIASRTMQKNSYELEGNQVNELILNPFFRGLLETTHKCKECGKSYKGKSCSCCMKEANELEEAISFEKYKVTSEPGPKGGHRPVVREKGTNHPIFVGQQIYKNASDAKAHAKVYLNKAYSENSWNAGHQAGFAFEKANKHKLLNLNNSYEPVGDSLDEVFGIGDTLGRVSDAKKRLRNTVIGAGKSAINSVITKSRTMDQQAAAARQGDAINAQQKKLGINDKPVYGVPDGKNPRVPRGIPQFKPKLPVMNSYEPVGDSLDEVLEPSMGAKAYIDDFLKSSRFKGTPKKQIIKQALAAYYAAKRGK